MALTADEVEIELASARQFFSEWCDRHGRSGAVGECAAWLASGDIGFDRYATITRTHGVAHEEWFRADLTDLLLEYAAARHATAPLTSRGLFAISFLFRALHLDGIVLVRHRPNELREIIVREIDLAAENGLFGAEDDRYLAEMQAAFDLSFDEFVRLARPALERLVISERPYWYRDLLAGQQPAAHLTSVEALYLLSDPGRRARWDLRTDV